MFLDVAIYSHIYKSGHVQSSWIYLFSYLSIIVPNEELCLWSFLEDAVFWSHVNTSSMCSFPFK